MSLKNIFFKSESQIKQFLKDKLELNIKESIWQLHLKITMIDFQKGVKYVQS